MGIVLITLFCTRSYRRNKNDLLAHYHTFTMLYIKDLYMPPLQTWTDIPSNVKQTNDSLSHARAKPPFSLP